MVEQETRNKKQETGNKCAGLLRRNQEYLSFAPVITETYYTRFYHSEGRQSGENTLSLFISPKSFQFAVFDQGRKVMRELCHIDLPATAQSLLSDADQLGFLLNNYRLSSSRFEKVYISVLHADFVILPVAFSEQVNQKQLLAFAGSENAPSSGTRHRLGEFDFCHTVLLPVQELLERTFSSAQTRHAGAVSINLLMSHPALVPCNVFLNVHEGSIELLARRNRQLLFYNVFPVETGEDILYYLLFMAEQFEIAAKEIVIGVGGAVSDDLLALIKKFTGELHLPSDRAPVPLTGKFSEIPVQNYFTLLKQHLCEL